MKRFLIYTQYFPPRILGASQSRLAALARQLVSLGHLVEVVTAVPNHLRGEIFREYRGRFYTRGSWEGITVHRSWVFASRDPSVRMRLVNYGSFIVSSLFGLAKTKRPDYIFVEFPPLFLTLPAVVYSFVRRVPMILNVADLWPESVKMLGVIAAGPMLALAERLEMWAYRNARYVNAVTDGIHAQLVGKKGLSGAKVLFLPNGVDTDVFYPRLPDDELTKKYSLKNKKVLLYAGTHGLAYRLDLLLTAARRLRERGVVVLFVGDGPTKGSLEAEMRDKPADNVFLIQSQPESEMPRYFSLAHASVIPLANNTLFEGTRPAKLFPSLASGVPVIYAGKGEGASIVSCADAGVVVEPESLDALCDGIRVLVEDSESHRRFSENARRYAVANFDWKRLVGQSIASLERRENSNAGTTAHT